MLDLKNPNHAYMFGFIQADGHMSKGTRNRGKVSIEIKEEDGHILEEFKKIIPYHSHIKKRKRDTNFKDEYRSICLTIHKKEFRDKLLTLGLPYGCKSNLIDIPKCDFSELDYYRGLIDGDGSLGITSAGWPFLSFVTKSEPLALNYLSFINKLTGMSKTTTRNKRDSVFNIVIFSENAQTVISYLYYTNCLCLLRKYLKALEILNWKRPNGKSRVINKRKWNKYEDEYILKHNVQESSLELNRTLISVKNRLWRLNNNL